jgi:hypothetical protein
MMSVNGAVETSLAEIILEFLEYAAFSSGVALEVVALLELRYSVLFFV